MRLKEEIWQLKE